MASTAFTIKFSMTCCSCTWSAITNNVELSKSVVWTDNAKPRCAGRQSGFERFLEPDDLPDSKGD